MDWNNDDDVVQKLNRDRMSDAVKRKFPFPEGNYVYIALGKQFEQEHAHSDRALVCFPSLLDMYRGTAPSPNLLLCPEMYPAKIMLNHAKDDQARGIFGIDAETEIQGEVIPWPTKDTYKHGTDTYRAVERVVNEMFAENPREIVDNSADVQRLAKRMAEIYISIAQSTVSNSAFGTPRKMANIRFATDFFRETEPGINVVKAIEKARRLVDEEFVPLWISTMTDRPRRVHSIDEMLFAPPLQSISKDRKKNSYKVPKNEKESGRQKHKRDRQKYHKRQRDLASDRKGKQKKKEEKKEE
jgi:hypothetical protein